jgi:hypothetical protein
MSFGADLRTKLLAVSAVSTKVGNSRVYWKYRPQNTALPAIVLHEVSGQMDQHFLGPIGTQGNRIQADCMAKTKVEAWALRDAVMAALIAPSTNGTTDFQAGFINLHRDLLDETPDGVVHTDQVDATIWFN